MVDLNKPSPTIATDINRYWLSEEMLLSEKSIELIGSYPLDYNHLKFNSKQYLIGMSVPPVMMANLSKRIFDEWLINLK